MAIVGPIVKVAGTPNISVTFTPAPAGWQPWNITSAYQVSNWDFEYVNTGATVTPFVYCLVANCVSVDSNNRTNTLKVWMPAANVKTLGGP